ncbi:MarR family winged helix-turn-helix transcriptional regulator [Thalassospira sp.]|uniref:MarR family winged helix-turn-helix transcriptional regulator n=1 Tax=Thalassospira sp. TaxID=1912094 RepID=UPI00273685FC|nr:MarR family winged helix-turn-helix transcriptional regulator [Thalassospira sp.]MDP2697654.1 MarR family winged helix-turn-helix transcriptional regulator [Thalassospira sp.]
MTEPVNELLPGETLHRLFHAYKRAMREGLHAANMPLPVSHMRTLKWIARTSGLTAQQIAAQTAQDKGRITRLLNELEQNGLIEKKPHCDDRRSQTLHLTPAGDALMDSFRTVETQIRTRMARGLSPKQIRDFATITGLMAENLES